MRKYSAFTCAEAEFPILMRSYWIIRDPTVQYNIAAADIVAGKLTSGFGGDRGGVAEVGQRISEISCVEQQTSERSEAAYSNQRPSDTHGAVLEALPLH